MKTSEFLNWVADRFIHVIGESKNVDFVVRLQLESVKAKVREESMDQIVNTYHLEKTDTVHMDGRTGYVLHRSNGPGAIGTVLMLTTDEAVDLSLALGFADHEKNHAIHNHAHNTGKEV